ncbi:MAG TPA: GNAT family N-acetyltransferase [Rhizomicrobium sp.]|jgi:acetyltransferase
MTPYPAKLERRETIPGFGEVLLRPVRSDDAPAIERFFARLSPEDVHTRFFSAMPRLSAAHMARLTGIDFDRDMALLLVEPASGEILAVGRLCANPDVEHEEFAITVRTDVKRHSLGEHLMTWLLDYAKGHGTREVFGDILADNRPSLALARKLGFKLGRRIDSPGIVRATLQF